MGISDHQASHASTFPTVSSKSIAMLCATTMCMGFAMAFVMPYSSTFALKEVGISVGAYGLMALLGALCTIGCTVGLGMLTDSSGRRLEVAIVCLVAGAVAFLLMALLPTAIIVFLVTVSLMAVFGAAPAQLLALSRVFTEALPEFKAQKAMAYVRATFSLAWAVGPSLGAYLLIQGSFYLLFGSAAALCVLAAVIALQLGNSDAASIPSKSSPQPISVVQSLLEEKQLRGYFFSVVCFSLCSNVNLAALPLLLADTDLSAKGVGYLFGLAAALEFILMLCLAAPLSRFRADRCLALGSLCYAIYSLIIFSANQDGIIILLCAQAFNALATTAYMLVGIRSFQEAMPNNPGASTALFASALTIGAILHGPIFSLFYAAFGAAASFLVCVALSLLGWFMLLQISNGPQQSPG